jgi:hypothetical protein
MRREVGRENTCGRGVSLSARFLDVAVESRLQIRLAVPYVGRDRLWEVAQATRTGRGHSDGALLRVAVTARATLGLATRSPGQNPSSLDPMARRRERALRARRW